MPLLIFACEPLKVVDVARLLFDLVRVSPSAAVWTKSGTVKNCS
jgi:hypothetical protein